MRERLVLNTASGVVDTTTTPNLTPGLTGKLCKVRLVLSAAAKALTTMDITIKLVGYSGDEETIWADSDITTDLVFVPTIKSHGPDGSDLTDPRLHALEGEQIKVEIAQGGDLTGALTATFWVM